MIRESRQCAATAAAQRSETTATQKTSPVRSTLVASSAGHSLHPAPSRSHHRDFLLKARPREESGSRAPSPFSPAMVHQPPARYALHSSTPTAPLVKRTRVETREDVSGLQDAQRPLSALSSPSVSGSLDSRGPTSTTVAAAAADAVAVSKLRSGEDDPNEDLATFFPSRKASSAVEDSPVALPSFPTSTLLDSASAHTSMPSTPRIGQHELQASDFQHEEVLGEGSYSLVTLATHRTSGLLFALKEIDRDRLRRLHLEPQLRWEINLQRTLRHPNIVRLYSYFVTPACISLVLEYCPGGTLLRRVQAAPQGRLSERQASRYTRHIAKALAHLHERGVAHRDLKLENVLLDADDIAKLADFGWSRPVGAPSTAETAEQHLSNTVNAHHLRAHGDDDEQGKEVDGDVEGRRTVCGTLDYLSPEMVSGRTHSAKTDVWSLGVMLAEMLTGAPPFYKPSPQQTLHAIRCEAPDLRGHVEGSKLIGADPTTERVVEEKPLLLSAGARALINEMLQKDPVSRPLMRDVLHHPWLQKSPRPSFQ